MICLLPIQYTVLPAAYCLLLLLLLLPILVLPIDYTDAYCLLPM